MTAFSTVADHYWRDYNGIVPTDAIAGGKNGNDQITYIGQMNVVVECSTETNPIQIIIATITSGNVTGVGAYQGKTITSNSRSNLKVILTRLIFHTT